MTDFKSSRTIVRASTIAGGDATSTHNFSGSVFCHDLAPGAGAAGDSNLEVATDGKIVLTAGGGGGGGVVDTYNTPGDDRVITSVNATTIQGEANFTFDGTEMTIGSSTAADIHITGTMRMSGTVVDSPTLFLTGAGIYPTAVPPAPADPPYFCLLADEDKDSAGIIGQAYMGYGGFLDRAVFGHKDSQAVPTAFAFMQKGLTGGAIEAGSVSINAPATGYLSFAINSAHKARFSVMNLVGVAAAQLADPPAPGNNPQSGFAVGTNYFPSYPLDVSGGIRIGTFTDKMQTNVNGGGSFIPSIHYVTGTTLHTGSYILRGAPGGFGTAGAHTGMMTVSGTFALSASSGPTVGAAFEQMGGAHKLPYEQFADTGDGPNNNFYTASVDWYYIIALEPFVNAQVRIQLPEVIALYGSAPSEKRNKGWTVVVKKGWSGSPDLLVDPFAGDTIDLTIRSQDDIGAGGGKTITDPFEALTLVSDGFRNWWIV